MKICISNQLPSDRGATCQQTLSDKGLVVWRLFLLSEKLTSVSSIVSFVPLGKSFHLFESQFCVYRAGMLPTSQALVRMEVMNV